MQSCVTIHGTIESSPLNHDTMFAFWSFVLRMKMQITVRFVEFLLCDHFYFITQFPLDWSCMHKLECIWDCIAFKVQWVYQKINFHYCSTDTSNHTYTVITTGIINSQKIFYIFIWDPWGGGMGEGNGWFIEKCHTHPISHLQRISGQFHLIRGRRFTDWATPPWAIIHIYRGH